MRLAALILGVISSLLGLLFGIAFMASINLLTLFDKNYNIVNNIDNPTVNLLSWVAIGCFIIGLISACLIMSHPRSSGKMIIAVSIIGFLFGISTIYMQIMNVLLLIAGIFALIGAKEIKNVWSEEHKFNESYNKSESVLSAWWNAGKKQKRI